MEVDTEPSAGPSIPPWRTRQTSPQICISEEDILFACEQLAAAFAYDDPDDHIRRSFCGVFSYVNELLSTDQQLCGRLVNLDEYRNNAKRFGEDIFIQLRDTADKNNWKALFKHSTLYLYLTRTH